MVINSAFIRLNKFFAKFFFFGHVESEGEMCIQRYMLEICEPLPAWEMHVLEWVLKGFINYIMQNERREWNIRLIRSLKCF